MIKIIAHRGYWLKESEKNTAESFIRAFQNGFGIETDFRDLNGRLVVSHDAPVDGALKVENFIEICKMMPISAPIALNIKSDGLHSLVKRLIAESGLSNYFVFDMSVPDTKEYLAEKIPVFTRLSEYETTAVFFDQCKGVWLDAFESEWYDAEVIQNILDKSKEVAIVSPELHRRPHLELWDFLKKNRLHQNALISICTDFPLDAKDYFNA